MNAFADRRVGEDQAVLDDSAGLDGDVSADDAVVNRAFDHAAVGDEGVLDGAARLDLGRAGIGRLGVDRPVRLEEVLRGIEVCERQVGVIVALKVCDRCEVTLVSNRTDIQLCALRADDLSQRVGGGDALRFLDELDEEVFLHDIGLCEDVLVLRVAEVALDRLNTLLAVQVEDVAVQEFFLGVVNLVEEQSDVRAGLDMCG